MKSQLKLLLAGLLLASPLSSFAQGGAEPLRNSAGALSPVQTLQCGSESVNISVNVDGETANISVNDNTRVYECTGVINTLGAELKCQTSADDAPKSFSLNTNPSGDGSFSFSGSSPVGLTCSRSE